MNSDVMPSRVRVEPILLQQLVAEVKETVATGVNLPATAQPSSFKAINFWNLQRRGRYVNNATNRKKSTAVSLTHVSF